MKRLGVLRTMDKLLRITGKYKSRGFQNTIIIIKIVGIFFVCEWKERSCIVDLFENKRITGCCNRAASYKLGCSVKMNHLLLGMELKKFYWSYVSIFFFLWSATKENSCVMSVCYICTQRIKKIKWNFSLRWFHIKGTRWH